MGEIRLGKEAAAVIHAINDKGNKRGNEERETALRTLREEKKTHVMSSRLLFTDIQVACGVRVSSKEA